MEIVIGSVRLRYHRPAIFQIYVGPFLVREIFVTQEPEAVDINLGDNQFTTLHVQGLDAAGSPRAFIAPPAWTVDDATVVLITPATDGLSCRVEGATPTKLGTAIVTVTDSDDSTIPAATFNVTVAAEPITHLNVTADPPTEKS